VVGVLFVHKQDDESDGLQYRLVSIHSES
jgi:hypothetical protein